MDTQDIAENDVLIAIAKWLHTSGWQIKQVSIARGQKIDHAEKINELKSTLTSIGIVIDNLRFTHHGADIVATRNTDLWKIECKGMGDVKPQTLKTNFDRAVASVVSYYDSNIGLRIGLALPEEYFSHIKNKLPLALRKATNLWVLLYVSADDDVIAFPPDEELPD